MSIVSPVDTLTIISPIKPVPANVTFTLIVMVEIAALFSNVMEKEVSVLVVAVSGTSNSSKPTAVFKCFAFFTFTFLIFFALLIDATSESSVLSMKEIPASSKSTETSESIV